MQLTPDNLDVVLDRKLLVKQDWLSVAFICLALILAPLMAGQFSTPPPFQIFTSAGLADMANQLGTPILLLLFGIGVLITIAREMQRPVAIGALRGLAGATVFTVAWAAVSVMKAPVKGTSLNALICLTMAAMVAATISRLARDRSAQKMFVQVIFLAGTIVALIGLNEYISMYKQGVYYHRIFSTFANPTFLAGYMILVVPVSLSLFQCQKEAPKSVLIGIGLLVQSETGTTKIM